MVLVGASEAFTGLAIAEQTAWGTEQTTDAEFARVLLINETLSKNIDELEVNPEFGDAGAQNEVEFGREITRGEISWRPRYDDPATHLLIGHFFGQEIFCLNNWATGHSATPTLAATNTHGYVATTTIPKGLTARIFKSGPSAAGYYQRCVGLIPIRLTWDQAENRPAQATVECIGIAPALVAATGETLPAIMGTQLVKFADLSRANVGSGQTYCDSRFRLGLSGSWANMGDVRVKRFRFSLSRQVDFPEAVLTEITPASAPLKLDKNEMTLELEFQLEQIDLTAGTANWHPLQQITNRVEGQLDVRYVSASVTTDNVARALRFHMPKIAWTTVDDSLRDAGVVTVRCTGTAIKGTVVTAAASDNVSDVTSSAVAGAGATSDVRCFITVDQADENAWRAAPDKTFTEQLPGAN